MGPGTTSTFSRAKFKIQYTCPLRVGLFAFPSASSSTRNGRFFKPLEKFMAHVAQEETSQFKPFDEPIFSNVGTSYDEFEENYSDFSDAVTIH